MDYKEFEDKVIKALQEKLGGGCHVETGGAGNYGGAGGHSILIGRQGINASMAVKMDRYYGQDSAGEESTAMAVSEILDICRDNLPDRDIDVSKFLEWDSIKPHIRARLANTERNRERLENVPHREFLDLSLEYYADMGDVFRGMQAGIWIRDEHMLHWGVDEDVLYRTAMKNMGDAEDMAFEGMDELLTPFFGTESRNKQELLKDCPMFVLGSRDRRNGAVWMCCPDAMERISGFFKRDFWILPSSIHEVILLPAGSLGEDAESLARMVREVNDTQLAPEEILSYHVYRYSRLAGEISIAA